MINEDKIRAEFARIKNLGFIKSNRIGNTGIGKTFEDNLGLKENNLKDPDFDGFEVKSQRHEAASPITLFTKSPSSPRGANLFLKKKFGIPDPEFPHIPVLHASFFGNKDSLVYDKFFFTLKVDRERERVVIVVKEKVDKKIVYADAYYTFSDLSKIVKLENTFIVWADREHRADGEYFHYTSAQIFYGLSLASLLACIEDGTIQYDIRCGVYRTGRLRGKAHDHGSGMRINKNEAHKLFAHKIIVE